MTTIKEMDQLFSRQVSWDDMPYAILMNPKNFRILQAECSQSHEPIKLFNFQSIPLYAGIPVVINEDYDMKAVTEQEYREIYKASK